MTFYSYHWADNFVQLTKYPVLNQFEQRTQVPKSYAVLGTITLLTLLIFINPLAAPISNIIGWGFPAYLSFKALETPQHQDDVQWLTYWIVFGFFTFLESFALRLVLYYFPFYFAFKTVFVIWLQLPAFKVSFDERLWGVKLLNVIVVTGCYETLPQPFEAVPCRQWQSRSNHYQHHCHSRRAPF